MAVAGMAMNIPQEKSEEELRKATNDYLSHYTQ